MVAEASSVPPKDQSLRVAAVDDVAGRYQRTAVMLPLVFGRNLTPRVTKASDTEPAGVSDGSNNVRGVLAAAFVSRASQVSVVVAARPWAALSSVRLNRNSYACSSLTVQTSGSGAVTDEGSARPPAQVIGKPDSRPWYITPGPSPA